MNFDVHGTFLATDRAHYVVIVLSCKELMDADPQLSLREALKIVLQRPDYVPYVPINDPGEVVR